MMMKFPLVLSLTGALALSACVDPNTDPNANKKSAALAGAALGAAIGAATGDNENERWQRAAIGGLVGAGAGAVIGANLDRQAAEMRASLNNPNISVTNMGDYLVVNMPQDLLFATDSASLNSSLVSDISAVGRNLVAYPNSKIQVVGHTDNTGSAAYNAELSLRRATAVAQVLMNSGVPASRIVTKGKGMDSPIASNSTPEGRAKNRRVEIIIKPTK